MVKGWPAPLCLGQLGKQVSVKIPFVLTFVACLCQLFEVPSTLQVRSVFKKGVRPCPTYVPLQEQGLKVSLQALAGLQSIPLWQGPLAEHTCSFSEKQKQAQQALEMHGRKLHGDSPKQEMKVRYLMIWATVKSNRKDTAKINSL
jgi:hypothetical protein